MVRFDLIMTEVGPSVLVPLYKKHVNQYNVLIKISAQNVCVCLQCEHESVCTLSICFCASVEYKCSYFKTKGNVET